MREIQLHGKYGTGQYTIVDDEDFEELNKYKWNLNDKGFVIRVKNRDKIRMHRQILKITSNKVVVRHKNENRRDNRKINLIECNQQENTMLQKKTKNSYSIYKGVDYVRKKNLWRARIKYDYKEIRLGYFDSEIQAGLAYDKAAIKYFGTFSCLNFPEK